MTKLEGLRAACEATQGAYYDANKALAAALSAHTANHKAAFDAWYAYYDEVKKQENSND
jgi:hypothetical protein